MSNATIDLLAAYTDETNPATWTLLAEIAAVLARVADSPGLQEFVRDLAGPTATAPRLESGRR